MPRGLLVLGLIALIGPAGCVSPTKPKPEVGAAASDKLGARANFAKFAAAVRVELGRTLTAAGFAEYSEQEMEIERQRFLFLSDAWKLAGQYDGAEVTRTVRLYADFDNQHVAVFVEATGPDQKPVPGEQASLEKTVGEVVAKERYKFEKNNPDSQIQESRDRIPASLSPEASR